MLVCVDGSVTRAGAGLVTERSRVRVPAGTEGDQHRETGRQTDRQTETERQRQRDRDRQTDRERERQRQTDRQRELEIENFNTQG